MVTKDLPNTSGKEDHLLWKDVWCVFLYLILSMFVDSVIIPKPFYLYVNMPDHSKQVDWYTQGPIILLYLYHGFWSILHSVSPSRWVELVNYRLIVPRQLRDLECKQLIFLPLWVPYVEHLNITVNSLNVYL